VCNQVKNNGMTQCFDATKRKAWNSVLLQFWCRTITAIMVVLLNQADFLGLRPSQDIVVWCSAVDSIICDAVGVSESLPMPHQFSSHRDAIAMYVA